MAEAVLFNIAEKILGNLGSEALQVALQEVGLLVGVQGELDKLKNTISTIRDVLLDAEEKYQKSDPSHQIRGWLAKLKDAVYEADDLLDEFSTEALRRKAMAGNKVAKEVRLFFSSSNQLEFRRKMGHKIKKIRETLDAIAADRNQFHLEERRDETQVVARNRDQTHSDVPKETQVIGRERDKEAIIKHLLDSNVEENVLIIPIVGMGGLGKTTLAQLVYNDDSVKTNFEPKLWVCVSENFEKQVIVEKIIESATNRKPDQNLQMNTLKNHLQDNINGKKYLLVLDDVWNEVREKWIGLKDLLMGGAKGSIIIITTRSEKVAKITSTISPYILKGLPENESWFLFTQLAFKKGQKNPSLVEIGREIVRKCCGVPLAIRTIGALLYDNDSEEWERVKRSEFSDIKETSILPILKLSYDNLPSRLKHCFAYCRLFPKDHVIDVEMLIYLWMGQGFIEPLDPSKCLKKIGLGYFKVLFWRSFFQEVEEDEFGNAKSCKMHDLMHDLAVEVAGNESIMISSDRENIPKNTRHVSINHDFDLSQKIPVPMLKANKIRTFLLTKNLMSTSHEEIWSDAIVSKFRCLRMLDLHGLGIERVPHSIGKLKHLRYLDLSSNYSIKILPSSISRLQNLLVVKLSDCESLIELPNDIKKLVSLTILEIDGCWRLTHMPRGLGQLTSLEKLTRFIVSNDRSNFKHCGGLNELKGLNSLRGKLSIENLNFKKNAGSEYTAANLKEKEHLQSLILEWGSPVDVDIDVDAMSMEGLQPHRNLKKLVVFQYPGVMWPTWLSSSFLTNLVNIQLEACERVKYLPPLDEWTSLRDLTIGRLTNLEYIHCDGSNCSSATFFSSLEKLKIRECPNLKGWKIVSMETTTSTSSSSSTTELPPFPCLSKLDIYRCPNLTSIPLFPSTTELRLYYSSGKPLEETMMMRSKAASSASASPPLPLSKLKSLWIHGIHDLEYLPYQGMRNLTSLHSLKILWCNGLLSLEGEGFSGLISLRSLEINWCPSLKSISGVFQHCTALVELSIWWCRELDLSDVAIQFQASRSLRFLSLCDIQKLVTLPVWLQHFTTLQELHIRSCSNLTSLPEGMRRLTSLQKLKILGCPQLSERWGNNMGVDWPHIAHIPNIEIDYQDIQLGCCYQLG